MLRATDSRRTVKEGLFLIGQGEPETTGEEELFGSRDNHYFKNSFLSGFLQTFLDQLFTNATVTVLFVYAETANLGEFSGIDLEGGAPDDRTVYFGDKKAREQLFDFPQCSRKDLSLFDKRGEKLFQGREVCFCRCTDDDFFHNHNLCDETFRGERILTRRSFRQQDNVKSC